MMPLPVTVVAGFLGAGKTTLINRLLGEDHGLKLMVIVNDFGAINIDAALLHSADADTIALTNGCVCCTMGEDLHRALDQALDRAPRPDHLIIEASGVADPVSIANAVIVEPELSYAGIISVVDGLNLPRQLRDPDISEQVTHQIETADMVLVSKVDVLPPALSSVSARNPQVLPDVPLMPLISDVVPMPKGRSVSAHPAYVSWNFESTTPIGRADLGERLDTRPNGLYRLKGTILTDDGGYEVHIVGGYVSARRASVSKTQLVGLGPAGQIDHQTIVDWWGA